MPDPAEAGDGFGRTVVSGDFDGDGYADLAIGAAQENVGSVSDAGAVTVMYGSASGVTTARVWSFDTSVAGLAPRTNGRLGWALAAGDFNGDGRVDLAAGAPGQKSSCSSTDRRPASPRPARGSCRSGLLGCLGP